MGHALLGHRDRRGSRHGRGDTDDDKIAVFSLYSTFPVRDWEPRGKLEGDRLLADSLQKQEETRDFRGRFLKGRSGNPKGRFNKGQSGNPQGRRPGTRNKATEITELLLAGEAEALTRKAVERALEGDAMALRLCLDRIAPLRCGRPVHLGLAPVRSAADLGNTMAAITTAATNGVITPGEAGELARAVEIFVRAIETSDFERRLRAMEEQVGISA